VQFGHGQDVEVSGVRPANQELPEVEAECFGLLPGDVDRDEGVRRVLGDQQVLGAGVAVPGGARQCLEPVEQGGDLVGERQQVVAQGPLGGRSEQRVRPHDVVAQLREDLARQWAGGHDPQA
jgi:hypothetical protein